MALRTLRRAAVLLCFSTLLAWPGCSSGPERPTPHQWIPLASLRGESLEEDIFGSPSTSETKGSQDVPSPNVPLAKSPTDSYLAFHLEFTSAEACQALSLLGGTVLTRFDRWADILISPTRLGLAVLGRTRGLLWADRVGTVRTPPVPPPGESQASRGISEPIVHGGIGGLKGKGVILAVVDSGLDFRHPDFIIPDGQGSPTSRVLYLWDTTAAYDSAGPGSPGPISYPNGAPLGVLYSRDQLTAELRSGSRKIGATDENGHGTKCAGVAAGNGLAYPDRRHSGVAPEADLIAVRIGSGKGRMLPNSYLLGAICDWVDRVAGPAPAVISCSFGGQAGPHDGHLVLERQLDARFSSKTASRALCVAAGNEGAYLLHAEQTFGPDTSARKLSWTVPKGSQAAIDVWFATADPSKLLVESVGEDPVDVTPDRYEINPLSQSTHLTMETGPGSYEVLLLGPIDGGVTANAYIHTVMGEEKAIFTGESQIAGKQINTPGSTHQAITVGSYDFNAQVSSGGKNLIVSPVVKGKSNPLTIGALSSYSNPGPLRFGDAVKPELVAPGQYHIAARAEGLSPDSSEMVESSGKYATFNGTSAATPYCAGVIALMLEKNPKLTVGEIRNLVCTKASKDRFTGQVPNPSWGHGKLDLMAVRSILAAVEAK